jgi:chorismate dehydratase
MKQEFDSPLRIGAVSFLNTVPLIHGLDDDDRVRLMRDLPSQLANLLYEERIDVGLIPIVEYLRGVGGDIVPGICIASDGPVRTVKVYSRVPLDKSESIAVDRGSRSSVAMLRVILAERFDRHPDMHTVEPDPADLFREHQTVLVIGDATEKVRPDEALYIYDLGQLWREMTGLPFVYAAWVLSETLDEPQFDQRRRLLIQLLKNAYVRGINAREELAAAQSLVTGRRISEIYDYWQHCIRFELGEAELQGLTRFAELCAKHKLSVNLKEISVAEA